MPGWAAARRGRAGRKGALCAGLMLGLAAAAGAAVAMGGSDAAPPPPGWASYRDARLGFALAYPASIFAAVKSDPTAPLAKHTSNRSGLALRSRDGQAALMVAVFENVDRATLDRYRSRALAANYKDARITYQRQEQDWFVVSGFRGKDIFYERVTFSCGGKMINVWGLTYPSMDRDVYDRIVEAVAANFRPVERRDHCA